MRSPQLCWEWAFSVGPPDFGLSSSHLILAQTIDSRLSVFGENNQNGKGLSMVEERGRCPHRFIKNDEDVTVRGAVGEVMSGVQAGPLTYHIANLLPLSLCVSLSRRRAASNSGETVRLRASWGHETQGGSGRDMEGFILVSCGLLSKADDPIASASAAAYFLTSASSRACMSPHPVPCVDLGLISFSTTFLRDVHLDIRVSLPYIKASPNYCKHFCTLRPPLVHTQ
ncbi:hypothetical protein RRG08_023074 [Elysia crispata]|uniref:Uncharacterized protein n=1 Tax=Elysia crispata TaxID=231223 RepID=A0AAE1ASY0_9GAST|nr:hypothetical protein RRG08_023074 [Elysia crispata]